MLVLARCRLIAKVVLVATLLAAPLHAANPRDELLRFVPDDVGFCVVVQNLRETGKALASSPFVEQFQKSAFGKKLAEAKEVGTLLGVEAELKKHLGVGLNELRDDILGDAVVFAYRPGKAGEDQALMLIRARDAKPLADLISRFNAAQKEAGDLKELKELKYKGNVYYARVEKRETSYYHLRGPVLVFSAQEEMLQRALDVDVAAPIDTEPSLVTWLRQLGADKALFAVYINPRAFDGDLAAKVAKSDETGAAFLKTFLVYWKALDGIALSLTLDRDATLAVGVRGRSDALPSAARRLFAELAKPSDLWRTCPDDALFAFGARIDFAALAETLSDFLTGENQKSLHKDLNRLFVNAMGGKDVVKDVFPSIGPDIGLWLTAPTDAKHLFPEGVFALRVRAGDKSAPIDRALLGQLNFFAQLAVFGHGQRFPDMPLTLKTAMFGKQEVSHLESQALPPGVRPAFALKDGFLLLAGTPEAIGRFSAPPAAVPEGDTPLLRISFKTCRTFIQARRAELTKAMADKDQIPLAEAAGRMDGILAALEFVDRLEIRHRVGKGHAVVSVVIAPVRGFKK
jgi:hypothetical protein